MEARNTKQNRIFRDTLALTRPYFRRENGGYGPLLVLGVLTTLLAMVFSYLVYDARVSARATGNRVLWTELDAGGAAVRDGVGGRSTPPPSFLRIVAGAVSILDDMARDAMFALRGDGGHPATNSAIAVIAVDETSLERHATWPWPRTDVARLLRKAADASVIGMDILFPDQDKTSLSRSLPRIASLFGLDIDASAVPQETLDNDLLLARQMARSRTVLGMLLFDGARPPRRLECGDPMVRPVLVLPDGSPADPASVLLEDAEYAATSISRIRRGASPPVGEGFMNLFPLSSGVLRSIPVLARVSHEAFAEGGAEDGRIIPSFVLEVVRVHLGGDGYRVDLAGSSIRVPAEPGGGDEHFAVSSLSILRGEKELLTMPLSEFADMEVTFRNSARDYTVYPAWEVLAGMHDGAFTGKIVFIGGTTAAVGHVVSAGLQMPEVSTVTAHASMAAAMLKGDFFHNSYRHNYFWRQVFILGVGLAVTLSVLFGGVLVGAAAAALCAGAVFATGYFFFFIRGEDVGVTLPVASAFAVLAVLVASHYLSVGRERRFIRRAFAQNVSPSILAYLEMHPNRLTSLSGEHRNMTVLFTDIRGFTSMSERMTAPDLARFLNEYLTPMSDIVMRNTGTVDKFIGDGMMAFWNAPTDNPDHARDAARAGLEMVAELDRLQPDWTSRGLPKIRIGCGINTGPMFAGNMGSETRKNYTVMGDNVNIASRLEELNKVYSSNILVTESTRRALGADFICRVTDKVRVSGKEEAVVIYELLGEGVPGEEKLEELAAFARVFELYQQKEFATAETLLKELVFIRPAPLYKLYLDRLAIYKALPPPPDWDGTFAKMSK